MAEIECEITFETMENDRGIEVDGTKATCTECGHETTSFGTKEGSIKRCLALMREECPEEKKNYYVGDVDGG